MVCKYQGDHAAKELLHDNIYREHGAPIVVSLCYHHSWELFRAGQKKFLSRYQDNFMQVFGTETEAELIEYLKGKSRSILGQWAA